MNVGKILAIISIIIGVGPLASAALLYSGNPMGLIMPDVEEFTEKFEGYFPTIESVDFEIVNPGTSNRVLLNMTNNSDDRFTFDGMNFSVYCKEHNTLLGYGYGENLPMEIASKSFDVIELLVTFNQEGQMHIATFHRGDTNFYEVLRDITMVVQGVTVEMDSDIEMGPIEIPA